MFEHRVLTNREREIVHRNCVVYDMLFEAVGDEKRCGNDLCRFPLSAMDNKEKNFFILGVGDVCNLCYTMYYALVGIGLKDQKYFRVLSEEWTKNKKSGRERMGL